MRERDLSSYREDFPILRRLVHGRPLVYLDSAATSLKPRPVIEAVLRFYEEYTANVHRAVHALAEEATEAFESARARVARFINADTRDVVFVRHATEALNMAAQSLAGRGPVVMPLSEHHSNLLPWRTGQVATIDLLPDGRIDLASAAETIERTRPALVTFSTISNALGMALPVAELTALARQAGSLVMLDLSQAVGHQPVDVRALDCDLACFSGHKMLGPGGIGVLYCRDACELLRPVLLGGSMVHEVHRDTHTFQPWPWGLEAGTPHIEGVIGLAAACDYLEAVGLDAIAEHGRQLIGAARVGLGQIPSVRIHGPNGTPGSGILAFSLAGQTAHGVARALSNRFGIMVRSGFHCAQPLHEACALPESVRASVHLYSTPDEIDALIEGVATLARMA